MVTQAGQEIGREEFTLRAEPRTRAAGHDDHRRRTLSRHQSRRPASPPRSSARPTRALAKFQLDVESGGVVTVILAAGSGARLIVRTVAKGSESGRELPGGPGRRPAGRRRCSRSITPVAELATPAGRTLTAIFPRTGKRATFIARRESGTAGGARRIALERRHRRDAGDRRAGPARAAGAPGQDTVVARARVGTPPKSFTRTACTEASSQPETWWRGGPYGPRPRPHLQRAPSMIRWLGLLALLVLCPRAGAAQDTTTAARPAPAADTTAALRPAPAVTLSLQEALQQARANSPDLPADAERRRARQVGRAERLRQPAAERQRRLGPGVHRLGPVEFRRRLHPADLRIPHLGLQSEPSVAARRPRL